MDIQWWMWGVLYAAGGAALGAWFLRELRRNATLQSRIDELADVFKPLWSPAVTLGLFVAGQMMFWPIVLAVIIICDVPGHGRNVDHPDA